MRLIDHPAKNWEQSFRQRFPRQRWRWFARVQTSRVRMVFKIYSYIAPNGCVTYQVPLFLGKTTRSFPRTWFDSGLSHRTAICQENWAQVCWVATRRWYLTISMTESQTPIPRNHTPTHFHPAENQAFFTTASSIEVWQHYCFAYLCKWTSLFSKRENVKPFL